VPFGSLFPPVAVTLLADAHIGPFSAGVAEHAP
jgi:hypothetical protein